MSNQFEYLCFGFDFGVCFSLGLVLMVGRCYLLVPYCVSLEGAL